MEQAIASYLPISEALAWGFYDRLPGGADLDELKSVTAEALVISASRWVDPYCSSRGYCPWDPRDPAKPEQHWGGYCIKRMKGALLDWARGRDLATRSARRDLKALRRAEDDGIRGEQEQAAAAGLSIAKARQVRAAGALSVVSLDDQDVLAGGQYAGAAVLDHGADVEAQAVVSETLAGFLKMFDALDAEVRVVLAMHYHRGLELADVAGLLFTTAERVAELHDAGVLAVHKALLAAVSA